MNCPRCDAPAKTETLREFGGVCEKCLLDFAAEQDAPRFPNLEIVETLGEGGMGVVYKAVQKQLGRTVALKVLSPALASDPSFVERFTREARALASLSHPNIVSIHDFGVHDGVPYLVMEFVDGIPLRKLLGAGKLTPERALEVVPQICDALAYAHARGVVHRDVKPENILLDREGRVKIADFGLAKLAEPDQTRITRTNALMGTPHYMAPEQLENPNTVDHRADIYSLGVIFYEMLTGELPLGRFKAPSEKAAVDRRLDPVVLKSLEKEPADRWQSAADVKERVTRLEDAPAPAARPHPPYFAKAVSCFVAAGILVLLALVMESPWVGFAGGVCAIVGASHVLRHLYPERFPASSPASPRRPRNPWPWLSLLLTALALALAAQTWVFPHGWAGLAALALAGAAVVSALIGFFAAPLVDGRRRGRGLSSLILLSYALSVPLLYLSAAGIPGGGRGPSVSLSTCWTTLPAMDPAFPLKDCIPPGMRAGSPAELEAALAEAQLEEVVSGPEVLLLLPGRVILWRDVRGPLPPRTGGGGSSESWSSASSGPGRGWNRRRFEGPNGRIDLYYGFTSAMRQAMERAARHLGGSAGVQVLSR